MARARCASPAASTRTSTCATAPAPLQRYVCSISSTVSLLLYLYHPQQCTCKYAPYIAVCPCAGWHGRRGPGAWQVGIYTNFQDDALHESKASVMGGVTTGITSRSALALIIYQPYVRR